MAGSIVIGFGPDEMERAALCSIMRAKAAAVTAAIHLTEGHFTVPRHRTLFRELMAFLEQSGRYDEVLFLAHLAKNNELETIGGAAAVSEIGWCVASGVNFQYYLDALNETRDRNDALKILKTAVETLEQETGSIAEIMSELAEIPLRKIKDRTFKDAIMDKLDRMENGEPNDDVLATGILGLDKHSPLRSGDMPLIAGERKAGKSILALTIAVNVAREKVPVLYFSLEDREPKVIDRIFAGVSRIPMQMHHVKQFTNRDIDNATRATTILADLPFQIRDDVYDLGKILALTRQAKAARDIGLVVIDYAQLVRCNGCDSRREEVEKVSRDLRLLAMELDVPILLLCQLNKEGDARESMALEMDATAMWRIESDEDFAATERRIVIPWQRNGESGIAFRTSFLGAIARVENQAQEREESAA